MKILATQYTLKFRAFEVYVAGCKGHCKNCHNPETWSFDNGDLYDLSYFDKISRKIHDFNDIIDNIMLFGGEVLDQNYKDLKPFLQDMASFGKPIWLFTRYNIDEIPTFVKDYCDYIKCGSYIEEFTVDDNIQYGVKLSTSNQKIYKKGLDY